MDSFSNLFTKEHVGQLILTILFIIYLIMGYQTPDIIANAVDSLVGKIIVLCVVISLFLYTNPILAVLGLFVAFDLVSRSAQKTGIDALQKYSPSEVKKSSQFTALNQFPYTLEQEIVSKMAPIVQSGSTLSKPTYKPVLENLHDATSI